MSTYKSIHIVAHTHWDREWYLPFETFRFRLVGLIDRLLRTMDEDKAYRFHLDGQVIALEDYLEIRPERRADLERFIREGRLTIGPWYVLVDEFLVSGESMIRNLEEGRRIGSSFGPMLEIGYLPDTFGHIAQMPQLLKEYGFEYALVWRGLNGTPEQVPTEFEWESPSGHRVKTVHLSHMYGYTSAMNLPVDQEQAEDRLRELIGHIGPHAKSGHVLLMNGFDHMEPQRHISAMIEQWNAKPNESPMKFSSIESYVQDCFGELPDVPVLSGEFRRTSHTPGGVINTILPNVLSARVYLKQQNATAQNLLERLVEPLEALALAAGDRHHPAFVRQAWKYVLQNHPHDSICGCSIDDVHDEMETRNRKAGHIGEQLVTEALARMSDRVDLSWLPPDSKPVLLFNPLPWRRDALAEIELDADDATLYRSVKVTDEAGESYEAEIVGYEKVCPIENDSLRYPLSKGETYRHKVRILVRQLPPLGYKTIAAQLRKIPELAHIPEKAISNSIENELVRITAEPDGTLTWLDLETGESMHGFHRFEDSGDVGDEYVYSGPLLNEHFTSATVRSVRVSGESRGWQRMTVSYELLVPHSAEPDARRRSSDLVALDIRTEVTLLSRSRTASVQTTVDNRALDHRLRLLFPMRKGVRPIQAGGAFDVSERPDRVQQPPEDVWVENEPTTFPFHHYVFADHGETRTIVNAHGLHEYEWIPSDRANDEGTLAITLLRSVAYLGGGDRGMATTNRPGPGLKTPGGQVQRVLIFHYGLTVDRRDRAIAPWRVADEQAISVQSRSIPIPRLEEKAAPAMAEYRQSGQLGWLEIDNALLQVTSLRPAPDDREGIELRLVNLGETAASGFIRVRLPILSAHTIGLNGEIRRELTLKTDGTDRSLSVELKPKEIVTIQFKTKE